MKTSLFTRAVLLTIFVLVGAAPLLISAGPSRLSAGARQALAAPTSDTEVAGLQAQVDRLKGLVPDQAHAMADVGYHFANLWFAAEKRNWPLARFCFNETRSHLRWAVRIIPVRKNPAGQDVDIKGILDAVDSGVLADVGTAIEAEDQARFVATYRQALEACYSCHKASGMPFLRPQVPTAPAAPILNFDPEAKWPQ